MRTLQCGRNVYETITGCVHSRGHIPDRDIYCGRYGMMRRWSGRCGVKAPVFADVARGQTRHVEYYCIILFCMLMKVSVDGHHMTVNIS